MYENTLLALMSKLRENFQKKSQRRISIKDRSPCCSKYYIGQTMHVPADFVSKLRQHSKEIEGRTNKRNRIKCQRKICSGQTATNSETFSLGRHSCFQKKEALKSHNRRFNIMIPQNIHHPLHILFIMTFLTVQCRRRSLRSLLLSSAAPAPCAL